MAHLYNSLGQRLSRLLGIALLCLIAMAHARDGDDWVLVERFEAQLRQAQAGNSQSMYEVGVMYETGRGTETSPVRAVEWLQRAVEKDNNDARARLGILYYQGKIIDRDLNAARPLLQTASKAGVPAAQYYLALMYEKGEGLPADANQALFWYGKAAEGGYYEARKRAQQLARAKDETPAPALHNTAKAAPARRKPEFDLFETLQSGHWQRNNRDAGFLPSKATTCQPLEDEKLRCLSGEQKRDTGYTIVTYITESIISGKRSDKQFRIKYKNSVLKTEPSNKRTAPISDGENVATISSVNVGQETEHELECKLENAATVVCLKDNITSQTFRNAQTGK